MRCAFSSQSDGFELTIQWRADCKVTVDDLDVLPSDTKHRVNEWLRGQTCVEGCTFRFEGKRPSVIRQHVTGCKARAQVLRVDPLKRLCQVQLDAQTVESRMCVRSLSSTLRPRFAPY